MPTEITTPRGKTPKDRFLWEWAFNNYGGNSTGQLGLAIKKYGEQYRAKYGENENGWIRR